MARAAYFSPEAALQIGHDVGGLILRKNVTHFAAKQCAQTGPPLDGGWQEVGIGLFVVLGCLATQGLVLRLVTCPSLLSVTLQLG